MWKLTIYQFKENTYTKEEETVTYKSRQEVSYTSENINDLLFMITTSSQMEASTTEYKIERVVE